jgi:hypothetical protein
MQNQKDHFLPFSWARPLFSPAPDFNWVPLSYCLLHSPASVSNFPSFQLPAHTQTLQSFSKWLCCHLHWCDGHQWAAALPPLGISVNFAPRVGCTVDTWTRQRVLEEAISRWGSSSRFIFALISSLLLSVPPFPRREQALNWDETEFAQWFWHFFVCLFIHMCIQCLGHFSPSPCPLPSPALALSSYVTLGN